MKRSRTRARSLGAPATESGKFLGVPTPLLVLGLVAAAGLAYANSGDGSTDSAAPTGAGTGTGTSSGSGLPKPTGTSSSGSSSSSAPAPKPARRPIVKGASPLLYVYVNSVGGEGIFDRLRETFSVLHAADGYGIDRIRTLDNGEFAGFATGKEWTSTESGRTYTQVYQAINGVGYNYWIEKSQTTQMHADGVVQAKAQATYMWSGVINAAIKDMTATSLSAIANFYYANYSM